MEPAAILSDSEHAARRGSSYAGRAAYLIATQADRGADACATEWDEMLKRIEAAARAGKASSISMASALSTLHGQRRATAEQKAKALSVAKEIASNPANGDVSRAEAIDFVGRADPDGRTFAEKLASDDGPRVKASVARIVQGKKP